MIGYHGIWPFADVQLSQSTCCESTETCSISTGIGLSSLEQLPIRGVRVTAEFCANSEGQIQTMITEAIKDGPKGYNVRKEVVVSDYNKPYALPVPLHQDCDMKVGRVVRIHPNGNYNNVVASQQQFLFCAGKHLSTP